LRRIATNKLFYNKYKYSLTALLGLSGIFRNKNLEYVRRTLDLVNLHLEGPSTTSLPMWIREGIRKGKGDPPPADEIPFWRNTIEESSPTFKLKDHKEALLVYQALVANEDTTVRVEYPNRLGLYSNDKDWLLDLSKKIVSLEFAEPSEKFSELLDDHPNVILTSQKNYKYKILFKGTFPPKDTYKAFAKWCKTNDDKIRITDQSVERLEKNYSMEGRYFFIKDDKTLTLVNLMIGPHLGRVYRLINKAEIDK